MTREEGADLDNYLHDIWKMRYPELGRPTFFTIRIEETFYVVSYVT